MTEMCYLQINPKMIIHGTKAHSCKLYMNSFRTQRQYWIRIDFLPGEGGVKIKSFRQTVQLDHSLCANTDSSINHLLIERERETERDSERQRETEWDKVRTKNLYYYKCLRVPVSKCLGFSWRAHRPSSAVSVPGNRLKKISSWFFMYMFKQ